MAGDQGGLVPALTLKSKAAAAPVSCVKCKKLVSAECFCNGCKNVICDACDVHALDTPWGPHSLEDHRLDDPEENITW